MSEICGDCGHPFSGDEHIECPMCGGLPEQRDDDELPVVVIACEPPSVAANDDGHGPETDVAF